MFAGTDIARELDPRHSDFATATLLAYRAMCVSRGMTDQEAGLLAIVTGARLMAEGGTVLATVALLEQVASSILKTFPDRAEAEAAAIVPAGNA